MNQAVISTADSHFLYTSIYRFSAAVQPAVD